MASKTQVKPTLKVKPQRPAAAPSTSPASLPYLQEGSTFKVVVGNVDRLARSGLSLREATQLALQRAGLQRFPKSTDLTSPTSSPTPAPTGT